MSLTLSTTSTSEISNVTDINPYQATRIVVHRPSTKMIESFSWTNSAIVVKEEVGCPNGQLSCRPTTLKLTMLTMKRDQT